MSVVCLFLQQRRPKSRYLWVTVFRWQTPTSVFRWRTGSKRSWSFTRNTFDCLFIELLFCVELRTCRKQSNNQVAGASPSPSPSFSLDWHTHSNTVIELPHNDHKQSHQVFFYWHNKLSGLLSKHVEAYGFLYKCIILKK